jgi:hypothetical protein
LTWTPRASGTAVNLNGVAWSGSLFAAVGNGGTILTSPDGMNWSSQSSGTTSNLLYISWSGTEFVILEEGSSAVLKWSP